MGDQSIQKVNQSLDLSGKQISIALLVVEVNMLISYPISDNHITDWTRTIDRLVPDLDLNVLGDILDQYKFDRLEWDKSKGIQNILRELCPKGYSPDETN